jgi:hypothetical protein
MNIISIIAKSRLLYNFLKSCTTNLEIIQGLKLQFIIAKFLIKYYYRLVWLLYYYTYASLVFVLQILSNCYLVAIYIVGSIL